MSKIAVVFWSGTGNTGVMATNVAEGAKEAGAEVDVIYVSDFSADKMDDYDAIAFGCPSMGAEQLEESEFEPVFLACLIWLIWLGRWRMDEKLGRNMQKRRCSFSNRFCNL